MLFLVELFPKQNVSLIPALSERFPPKTSAYSDSVPLIILLMFGERLKTVLGARAQQVRALVVHV